MKLGNLSLPLPGSLSRDFTASIVVFLVALPLCMGIAIASGVPAEKGLITGIIGGIVVGMLAGSPLQVSGPAAGLAVIVFEIVRDLGLAALGPILALAGLIQVGAGILRLGGWFRAISPAVVHGMLAGIGALIVVGQFHVLFDAKPLASGLENIAAMPARLFGLSASGGAGAAFAIGALTIAVMLLWEKLRPASLKLVPGALIGVLAGTVAAAALGLAVTRVDVPSSIMATIDAPGGDFLSKMLQPALLMTAIAIAFIASAETLLSAAAVDRMHNGVRTDYDKELRAQGVGNLLCGLAGALPMTGVIVRSSANVQAGALTRASTIFHGIWILGFVAILPWLLRMIPMAALGGILVVTGWRLVSVSHVRHLFRHHGFLPALIWAATFVMVVATDLLTGVLVGLGLSMLELLPNMRRLRLRVKARHGDDRSEISLDGAVTFLALPRLAKLLDAIPDRRDVSLDLRKVPAIDHSCAEMLGEWIRRRRSGGTRIDVDGNAHHLRRMATS